MGNKYKSARKGIYKPRNPSKWVQDKIIYRSSLEQKWFTYFDLNPNVISIASERIIIPYFDPIKNKQRKYYTDLVVKYKSKDGEIKIKLIEIKMSSETKMPKKPKKKSNKYTESLATYITNKAKWNAANIFSINRNWQFVILTEKNL